MKLDFIKELGLDLGDAWKEEYKRIGNTYASWGAILVVFMFPLAALPELGLEKQNTDLWYFFRFSPSLVVGLTFLLYRKFKFSHEIVFEVLALFIFASGAYRVNCEEWMSQMISNITLFITAAILTVLKPYILIINFVVIILINIGFHNYFCNADLLDFILEKSTPIFLVIGVASFSIAIFRYYLMKNNFLQRLALKKAYQELEETNTKLEESQEELSAKNLQITDQNEELSMQKEEIMSQRDVLEVQNMQLQEKNQDIMSSISYAYRIQMALLPQHSSFQQVFDDYFILFQPRDIVSGDFYWCHETNDYLYIAAIDCTGHGVPGALMSMMAHSALNSFIVNETSKKLPEILHLLDKHISKELKGESSGSQDGFDLGLCRYHKTSRQLEYAGAHHPLLILTAKGPSLIKGSKTGIGGGKAKQKTFESTLIQLQKGDVFFMYSDGFQDQFGGPNDKKYMSKRFRTLLLQLAQQNKLKSMPIKLKKELNEWMKDSDQQQIDDILVMGFKV